MSRFVNFLYNMNDLLLIIFNCRPVTRENHGKVVQAVYLSLDFSMKSS